MWLVILTTYNLPSWLCMKETSLMLVLLILDPKSLSMDIDIYLRPLINDLKDLWALKGVETIDVATIKTFNMRAMLLLTINDFPAPSSLSGWSGQVNGVRFVVHNRDERCTPQNNGIYSPGEKDRAMYFGQLEEILDSNDLDFATLNIDGQSMDVEASPNIIDADENDDFIDDEDDIPHDFADSDDEVLTNDDDDDVAVMLAAVARGHGGGDDPSCPPSYRQGVPDELCFLAQNRGGEEDRGLRKAHDGESSETREYLSLIQTFFDTHTDGGKFAQDEVRVQY
ncbi:reverse transcriptase domain-containing protein, partial [Tanacetum coccineum]